jgi:4,5-DOPA dioxygenase extradiol
MSTTRTPVLFVGHGSPMNAIEDNRWSRAFRALGPRLPRPRSILAISAHWTTPGTFLTGGLRPETIHDFGGFPRRLSELQYPASGDPALVRRVTALLAGTRVSARTDWGLDHGTWSVLCHLLPDADVPVVQLSLDERLAPAGHLALGAALAPLRDEGVLILGSGNATHNLRDYFAAAPDFAPDWARAFDAAVAERAGDGAALAALLGTPAARQAHPTLEHALPLLYAAAAGAGGEISFPVVGFDRSLSMRAILYR